MTHPIRPARGRTDQASRFEAEAAATGGPAPSRTVVAVPGLAVRRSSRRSATGNPLPTGLRSGMEAMSGADLSGVSVHYDSAEPARLDALAYTRGADIYLGPGQQEHLAHEAWHVVQQRQGRARPTESVAGTPVSADPALEAEASAVAEGAAVEPMIGGAPTSVVQRVIRGLADLRQPQDVPDDWVQRYLDDLLDDQAHLYLDEINAYLSQHQPNWLDHCHLENTDGNHWDVVFTDGSKPERVQTMADGSCGAHAISVIQARLAGVPDASGDKRAAAPPQLIQQVRAFAQQRLTGDHAEVRQRILAEIAHQDFIPLTGFGPRLQQAMRDRQLLQADHQHEQGKSGKGSEHQELGKGEQQPDEAPLPTIDVWTLLALPVAEIREVVAGYGLRDRKGLAFALRDKFIESFDAALRLPDEVVQLCVELLQVTPGPVGAVASKLVKQKDLPPAWQKLVTAGKKEHAAVGEALSEVDVFAAKHGYVRPKRPTLGVHELFEHDILTIYPKEREVEEDPFAQYRKTPSKGAEESARKRVHRPILDLEFVGGRFHARCYLGMFAPGTEGRKDVNADKDGTVQFHDIGLMNLGNPFKALLWCEDYLSSKEHEKFKPDPVVRSFLVPLASADWLLSAGARPLDQDRGSGQFGNYGLPEFDQKLNPLIGSLVSFFLNVEHLPPEPNQVKLPMAVLQEHLTGTPGDPRDMTDTGVAAQHGRKEHEAEFADPYLDALTAYYDSLSDTGFTDATQKDGVLRTGKWKRDRVDIAKVKLSAYPQVLAAFARIRSKGKATVRWS